MTHRPYILELYIIDISFPIFLSPFHLSVYFYCFTTHNQIGFSFVFMQKRFQLLQWYDSYIISWLVPYIQIMRSDELIISSIVISSYYGPVDFVESYNPKKTNESHTKHSNYIKLLIEFLFNLIELFIFFLFNRKGMKEFAFFVLSPDRTKYK